MRAFLLNALLSVFLLGIGFCAARESFAEERVNFAFDVRPILSENCFACHGPDESERKGGYEGLRLDTAAGAAADLGGYSAIVPGDAENSVLYERITSDDPDVVMPPTGHGKRLTKQQIEILRRWIEQGADYAGHWSYSPPNRPELPAVKNDTWIRNEIDRFVLARLEQAGLTPSEEADRATLIRRVSLDLTGLPPTLAEVDAFVNDSHPTAYEHLVERLLDKKAFGEHWARKWLDLARYADSAGYADDPPRTIWLYRDYVIRSLNANKPFDQFTIEQLAGDLLPDPTDEQLIATAFHRNTMTNNEGGTNDEEFRNVAVVDRVNTTFSVWMGTTMACAQCHTHKYDPLTQEEYFQCFAIFNNTADADRRDESPLLEYFTPEQQKQRAQWQAELAELAKKMTTPTPELLAAQEKWDAAFPRDLKWQPAVPDNVTSAAGAKITQSDEVVTVAGGAVRDTYTIEMPVPVGQLQAIRLEALTDESLPGSGPGHASGNFVITGIDAELIPPAESKPSGRYVRISIPGKEKILSLAEVQVFAGEKNLALSGAAKQSSTAFQGPAKLAIDGNTDGRFGEAASTTHTAVSKDPWWELDLSGEQPIERVVVWNRTDVGTVERLQNFTVSLLNEKRDPVWERTVTEVPRPSVSLEVNGNRPLAFAQAIADYSQSGFDAGLVIKNEKPHEKGWAIGGQTGRMQPITLLLKDEATVPPGAKLRVTIAQQSKHDSHTLGRFRLLTSGDPRTRQWARTPADVIAALEIPSEKRNDAQRRLIQQHYFSIAPALADERKQQAALNKQLASLNPVTVPVCRQLPEDERRVTHIQMRGSFLDLGKKVSPGVPDAFPPLPEEDSPDRLGLAHWLVSPDNPLTSRVIANRYWESIFGIGLVSTSEDFGSQGDLPSHPQLLDYLATELVRSNWNTKALLKLLVMSATYRQSSRVSPQEFEADPDNRLLARGPRIRLSAEMIRDQALFVSGLLSPKMYGPPVKPPQPELGLNAAFGGKIDWQTSAGEDRYRRGIYTTWRRSSPYPSMSTFDAPNREVCTVRRVRTNTPLQALVTLNDPVYVEAAQALGRRMMTEGGVSPADRAAYGLRLCLSRQPDPEEVTRLVRLYEQARKRYAEDEALAMKMATEPLGPLSAGMDVSEAAAWSLVGNVLLNLDETLMKR